MMVLIGLQSSPVICHLDKNKFTSFYLSDLLLVVVIIP